MILVGEDLDGSVLMMLNHLSPHIIGTELAALSLVQSPPIARSWGNKVADEDTSAQVSYLM